MVSLAAAALVAILAAVCGAGLAIWAVLRTAKQKVAQSHTLVEEFRRKESQSQEEFESCLREKDTEIGRLRAHAAEARLPAPKDPSLSLATESPDIAAKKLLLNSLQRLSVEYTNQATSAVVSLPSEDVKGRIIGREGRNIRTFEQLTGTDLIIDETPEAVVISSFDPIRREVARLTLMNLMLDGRIHPARIEEVFAKAKEEVEATIREAGEEAASRASVVGLPSSITNVLGKLKFRYSYAQNVLDHSVEVAQLCQLLAQELGLNVEVAKRAGLLHDIGKALDADWEGPHALAGMEFLSQEGEVSSVTHAVGAHHREIEPDTGEAQIVLIADAVSASRPGARREALDQFVKRLSKLEEVANSFPGVDRSFAIQAGRELRVLVKPNEVNDEAAAKLAQEIAKRIEATLQYPGQIKVTVIRETRSEGIAK